MDMRPAQVIARKFPTTPCLLVFDSKALEGRVVGKTTALVISVLDESREEGGRRVGRMRAAYIDLAKGGSPQILSRNLTTEHSQGIANHDTHTFEVLQNSEMFLLPDSALMREVIEQVINSVKDGLVDRSAAAVEKVGLVSARLEALDVLVGALPSTKEFRELRTEMLGVKTIAEAGELGAQALIADAEARLKEQARELSERLAGMSAKNAALEADVKELKAQVRRMLEANENVKLLDEIAEQKAAEAAGQALLSLDEYRARLQGMNFAQLRKELKTFDITVSSGETESLRIQAENAYLRRLQIQAAKANPAA